MDILIIGVVTTSILLFLLLTHSISSFGDIALAAISGLWASFTTLFIEKSLKQRKFYNRLKYLENKNWTGHDIKGRSIEEKIKSTAEIKYIGDTLLEMTVTHKDEKNENNKMGRSY